MTTLSSHTLPILTGNLETWVCLWLIRGLVWRGETLPGVESTVRLVDELGVPAAKIGGVPVMQPVEGMLAVAREREK